MAAVLFLIPVVWQLAFSERDGSSTCQRYPLPEGTIISESAELAVKAEVTALPPQLVCSYPVGDPASPTHVTVSHDRGAVWMTASACLFIVAAAMRFCGKKRWQFPVRGQLRPVASGATQRLKTLR
ncbi:hypothetical protein [Salinibacterium sp. ZJ450]|uniref:hypothetical protein n=1 Tax=Salinibacterium sp. ZJ450 TaxID=2708338 RepID=UPI0014201A23|nr:hypothetical protein [Salinibacterium sp. ZJ450]